MRVAGERASDWVRVSRAGRERKLPGFRAHVPFPAPAADHSGWARPSRSADGLTSIVLKIWSHANRGSKPLHRDAFASKARYVLDLIARDGGPEQSVFTNMLPAARVDVGSPDFEAEIVAFCRAAQELEEDVARRGTTTQVFVHGALPLPAGLSRAGRERVARRVLEYLEDAGLPYVATIQRPSLKRGTQDARNFHLQFVVSTRPASPTGARTWAFAPLKDLQTLGPEGLRAWRHQIATLFNEELQAEGIEAVFTPLTRAERGLYRDDDQSDRAPSPSNEALKADAAHVEAVSAVRTNIASLLALVRQLAIVDARLRRLQARRAEALRAAANRERLHKLDQQLSAAIQSAIGRSSAQLSDVGTQLLAAVRETFEQGASKAIRAAAFHRISLNQVGVDSRIDDMVRSRSRALSATAARVALQTAEDHTALLARASDRIPATELRLARARQSRLDEARKAANAALLTAAGLRVRMTTLHVTSRLASLEARVATAVRAMHVIQISQQRIDRWAALGLATRLAKIEQRQAIAQQYQQAKAAVERSLEAAAVHTAALRRVRANERTADVVMRRADLLKQLSKQATQVPERPRRDLVAGFAPLISATSRLVRRGADASAEIAGATLQRARAARNRIQEVSFVQQTAKLTPMSSAEQNDIAQWAHSELNQLLIPSENKETQNGPSILEPNRTARPRRYRIDLYKHGLQQASRFDTPIARAGLRDLSVSSLAAVQGRREVPLYPDSRRDVAPPKAGPLDPGVRRTRGSAAENERRDVIVDNIWDVRPSAEQLERMQSKLFRSPRWRPESGKAAQPPSSADQNSGRILPVGPLLPSASPGEQTSQPGEAAPPSPRQSAAWSAARRKDRESSR